MAMEVADFDLRSGVVLKRHVERRRAAGDAENQQSQNAPQTRHRRLTVKLRGRATTPARRRGRTLSSSARGAKQTRRHGTLQRLLAAMARTGVQPQPTVYALAPKRGPPKQASSGKPLMA